MKHISLNTHVRSDNAKWWIVAICLIVVGVVLCGLMTSWFADMNPFCWFGHKYDDNGVCTRCGAEQSVEEPTQANGNVVIEVVSAKGMLLNAAPAVASADEEQSYTLTATITPASADDKRVEWSVAWKNANSLWAIGKTVTDYVTVTPSADVALTAKVACIKDFGEQVIVTVKSLDNEEATAACTVDYVQRITGFTFNMPSVSSTTTSFTYDIEYSNYTIAADISIDVSDKCELYEDYASDLLADANSEFECAVDFGVAAPLLSKNGNTLTFAPDLDEFVEQGGMYRYEPCNGIIGCFIAYDEQYLDGLGLTEGDLIYMFRYELDYYETPCTFDVTYSATYNGKTYSQGTQTIGVKFDGQALHVPVDNVSLSQGSLVF